MAKVLFNVLRKRLELLTLFAMRSMSGGSRSPPTKCVAALTPHVALQSGIQPSHAESEAE